MKYEEYNPNDGAIIPSMIISESNPSPIALSQSRKLRAFTSSRNNFLELGSTLIGYLKSQKVHP
jgi:hypothetical protein